MNGLRDDGGRCLNCRAEWDLDFLKRAMGPHFFATKLKARRKAVMFANEQQFMHLTQPFLVHARAIREATARLTAMRESKQSIKEKDAKRVKLSEDAILAFKVKIELARTAYQNACARVRAMQQRVVVDPRTNVHTLLPETEAPAAAQAQEPAAAQAQAPVVIRCPVDACLGYVSTDDPTCGVCQTKVCVACHVVLAGDGPHTCDPDIVANLRTVASITRQCPKCHTAIERASGCQQMFCTMPNCHTKFSFATGQVITGAFHNPHYVEWMRTRGVEHDVVEGPPEAGGPVCDELGTDGFMRRLTAALRGVSTMVSKFLCALANMGAELPTHVTRPSEHDPRWRYHAQRMKLMDPANTKYDRARFERDIYMIDKLHRFGVAHCALIDMMGAAIGDTLREMIPKLEAARVEHPAPDGSGLVSLACAQQRERIADAADDALRGLVAYVNACLDDMEADYKYTTIRRFGIVHGDLRYFLRSDLDSVY